MKAAQIIIAAATAAALASCESSSEIATKHDNWFFSSEEDCECNNSYLHDDAEGMPEEGEVTIRVSRQDSGVKVLIYDGPLDGGNVVETFTASEQRSTVSLPVNRAYTYVAEYLRGGDTLLVPVNSKFKCDLNECKGRQCYFFVNNVVDLSLRF